MFDHKNASAKEGSVDLENKTPHNQQCFFMSYCLRMASDCWGFHVDKCVDFMSAKGNLPAGPRHHDLLVGGIKSKELRCRREFMILPNIVILLRNQRRKDWKGKGESRVREGYEMRLFVL